MMGAALRSAAQAVDGIDFRALDREGLDISEPDQIRGAIEGFRPDVLVNCAAFRDVDRAETEYAEAWKVNADGPLRLAEACRDAGIKLVHFGTHGVFDGLKQGPYVESDPARPLNRYAVTKLEGEAAVARTLPPDQYLILRISWPYGRSTNNFIGAILEAAKTKEEVRVVADHLGTPTPARLIAERTLALVSQGAGLFHLTCRGSCSRYELMDVIFRRLNLKCRLVPAAAAEFPTLAPRPPNIALATEIKWMDDLAPMPSWKDALEEFLRRELA